VHPSWLIQKSILDHRLPRPGFELARKRNFRIFGLECGGQTPSFQPPQWSVDGRVAVVTEGLPDYAELRAVGRGETRPGVALISQDGTSETAEFSYCNQRDDTGQSCVSATPLLLVVAR
jgi:hypothetical protein